MSDNAKIPDILHESEAAFSGAKVALFKRSFRGKMLDSIPDSVHFFQCHFTETLTTLMGGLLH
jgi:hypothetical protein